MGRGQPPALIVIQPQSPAAELFAQHSILLAQIIDGVPLLLIDPPATVISTGRNGSRTFLLVMDKAHWIWNRHCQHRSFSTGSNFVVTTVWGYAYTLSRWN